MQLNLRILLVLILLLSPLALSQSADSQPSDPPDAQAMKLPASSNQLAQALEVESLLSDLQNLEDKLKRSKTEPIDSQTIWLRQDFLSTKLKLVVTIETASLEVRAVLSRIDAEIASSEHVKGLLNKRKEREFAITTATNFMAAGVSRTASNSMKLSSRLDVPANILDIIDGAIQTSLPIYALYRIHGDRELLRKTPNMLSMMFDTSYSAGKDCPVDVWSYLNTAPPDKAADFTRRHSLTKRWLKSGLVHKESRPHWLFGPRKPYSAESEVVTADVLEDRLAMLFDLKATVASMEADLLQLLMFAKSHFQDPYLN